MAQILVVGPVHNGVTATVLPSTERSLESEFGQHATYKRTHFILIRHGLSLNTYLSFDAENERFPSSNWIIEYI